MPRPGTRRKKVVKHAARRAKAVQAKPTARRRPPTRRASAGRASEPRPASVSLWMATETILPRPPLPRSRSADVCVIGAGIAGLSAAYQLARAGRSVVVLDDGPIGGGQTGRTTAHLSHAMDAHYQAIQRLHGELAWE